MIQLMKVAASHLAAVFAASWHRSSGSHKHRCAQERNFAAAGMHLKCADQAQESSGPGSYSRACRVFTLHLARRLAISCAAETSIVQEE